MAHLHRFYHPETLPDTGDVTLSRDESHHAMRVVRARRGDSVVLFDGQGTVAQGEITVLARNGVVVAVAESDCIARPEPELTLAQAWLHRDKILDEMVRQGTVLGVAEFLFFRGAHSEKQPRLSDKWERIAIEACKQCGRRWLPRFTVVESLTEALAHVAGQRLVLAQMEGPHVPLAHAVTDAPITYVVGPEGDFSDEELAQAKAAEALPMSLGDCTYRAEMAAQVGITLIQHHLGFMGPR